MAKGKKSEQPAKLAAVCAKDVYDKFIDSVDETKGVLDSARMKNANAWKQAENLGVHPAAAKLMLKLGKMSPLARNDFLRAFDAYREYEDFDESDLIDDAEEKARGEAQRAEEQERQEEEVESRQRQHADRTIDAAADAEIGDSFNIDLEGDGEETIEEIANDDPEEAMKKGHAACRFGERKQTNPYDAEEETAQYEAWSEGWDTAYGDDLFASAKRDAA